MALSTNTKNNITSYVSKKIVSTGTVAEILDLLLFFELIQDDKDYCKMASYTSNVYEIYGFDKAAQGVYKLDHHFARRLKIVTPCVGKRINFNNAEVVDFLFERIDVEIHEKLSRLKNIYDCTLAKQYPELLAILLDELRKAQQYDNKDSLNKIEIKKIIRLNLPKKLKINKRINQSYLLILKQLTEEFYRLQRELKEVFSLDISANEIKEQREFFLRLIHSMDEAGVDDIISESIRKARASRFISVGADFHIRPGIYAGIVSQILAIVLTLICTAIVQWVFPLIPLHLSVQVVAMISAFIFSAVQFPIGTYLLPYLTHRREKIDNVTKAQLALNLGKAVPMYQARLGQKGFDLAMFSQRAFKIDPHLPASSGIFSKHKFRPSTGEGIADSNTMSPEATGLLTPQKQY